VGREAGYGWQATVPKTRLPAWPCRQPVTKTAWPVVQVYAPLMRTA